MYQFEPTFFCLVKIISIQISPIYSKDKNYPLPKEFFILKYSNSNIFFSHLL